METYGAAELHSFRDESAGLRGYVAIHNTTLGPAAGGTRRYAFETEEKAIHDVLRLSRMMTYKFALAGIARGGGKGVIWVDDSDERSEALYRAYGRAVDSFDGRFKTGPDVGTSEQELRWIAMETDHVAGFPDQYDYPSDFHPGAFGVVRAMRAACKLTFDDSTLDGVHVVVQGVGEMGAQLVDYLTDRGACVTISDVNQARVEMVVNEYDVDSIAPDDVYEIDCDVFAPCALGSVLNDETIPQLQCDVVCGAANNQLESEQRHGDMLHEAGIFYVPDYLANAGPVINSSALRWEHGYSYSAVREQIAGIYERMFQVGNDSIRADRPTYAVANEMAQERLQTIGELRPI